MKTIVHSNEVRRRGPALAALVGLWTMFFVMNLLRDGLTGRYAFRDCGVQRLAVAVLGVTLSAAMLLILAALPERPLHYRAVAIGLLSLPAALTLALGDFAAVYLWRPAAADAADLASHGATYMAVQVVTTVVIGWYFIFAAWGAVYLVIAYAEDVRASERRASEQRDQARIAELRMLKGQINPHFMFNMLNSISALVMRESPADAESLISEMAAFLRINLDSEPLDDVTLREECELQDRYLRLEGRRFPQRLFTRFELDDDTEDLMVPAMILQPLIENAVRHGVGRTMTAVIVRVQAKRVDGGLEIIVDDDAPLSGRLPLDENDTGFGMGLRNVEARLAAKYDGRAQFEAGQLPQRGYKVRLVIPETQNGG